MSFRWMKSTILILEAFILLESAYQEVDFYGDFKPGDLKLYDNFKLKFDKLTYHEVFNPRNISYRFFDMYEDGTPELGIGAETEAYSYIYKYKPDNDEFILIHELYPS